jgi:RNA polymerase sigma factor (sigma-70 family)
MLLGATPAASRREVLSDEALIVQVRAGADDAFEELYERYRRRITAYVHGMVSDHGRAEDITQEVFISALRRMRETDRAIAFKPWVYEIAKNACIDQFRRARRAEEVSYDADEGLGAADYGRLVQTGPTPDAAVDTKQQLDHLCGAFGGLSESHHEILVLRELEGMSYREIGERMGLTRPAVESTLFRARRRLTEEYDDLATGARCRRVQDLIASTGGAELGLRERRKLARHLSYCQPCRREARAFGVDAGIVARRPLREKIAALLPFPLPAFLRRGDDTGGGLTSGHAGLSSLGQSLEPLAGPWAKAAAAVATLALAGVGAGVATRALSSGPSAGAGVSVPSGALHAARAGSQAAAGVRAGAHAPHRSGAAGGAASPTAPLGGTRHGGQRESTAIVNERFGSAVIAGQRDRAGRGRSGSRGSDPGDPPGSPKSSKGTILDRLAGKVPGLGNGSSGISPSDPAGSTQGLETEAQHTLEKLLSGG